MRDLEPGDPHRLGDHELVGVLGTGGFGRVFVARAPEGRRLAVKLIHPHLLRADPGFVTRFAGVMGDLSRVRNLGAGRIVQWNADDVRPWYARRYVPGASLVEVLAAAGPLPHAALRIVAGVARGLAAMHDAELPHGGVTPGNVLVTATTAQLVDGGLPRLFGEARVRGAPAPVVPLAGPAFAPPEGADDTMAADVYALGLLLLLCVRGCLPDDPAALSGTVGGPGGAAAGLPDGVAALAAKLLDPVPEARPSAAEVVAELGRPSGDLATYLPRSARRAISAHALTGGPEELSAASPAEVAAAESGEVAAIPRARRGDSGLRVTGVPRSREAAAAVAAKPPATKRRSGKATAGEPGPEPGQAAGQTLGMTGTTAGTPATKAATKAATKPAGKSAGKPRTRTPGPVDPADPGSAAAQCLWTREVHGVQSLFMDDGLVFAGGESLVALDPESGKPVWSKPGWRIVGEPRDGRVYVTQGTRIALLDTTTGGERWRTDVAAARGLWARGASRLVRAERAFRLHAVFEPAAGVIAAIGGHTEVFGLDPTTGELLWNRREPRRTAFTRDDAGAVYLSGDGREPMRALHPATGELLWSDDAEDSIVTAVDRGWVLCARFRPGTAEVGSYVVRAAETGELVHRDISPGDTAILEGGVLYVLGGGELRALRPGHAKQLWSVPWAGGTAGLSLAADAADGYLRGEDRRVHAVDLADGSVRWTSAPIPARQPLDAVGGQLDRTLPVLADGDVVCVRSHSDSVLIVLDRTDGRELWWWRAWYGTLTMVAPVVSGAFVYVVDGDRVRALTVRDAEAAGAV